jgi:hypothetical protein
LNLKKKSNYTSLVCAHVFGLEVSCHHEVNLEKGMWQNAIQVIHCVEKRVSFYGSVSEGYEETK